MGICIEPPARAKPWVWKSQRYTVHNPHLDMAPICYTKYNSIHLAHRLLRVGQGCLIGQKSGDPEPCRRQWEGVHDWSKVGARSYLLIGLLYCIGDRVAASRLECRRVIIII